MYWKITSDGNRDESRSHYLCWRRPSFMATEHNRDEMVPAWIPGHPRWVFVFCPLKFDSTRLFLACVSTQSSMSYFPALKPWAQVSGSQKVFLSLKIYCSLPVLWIFSTINLDLSFYSKIKGQLHLPCCQSSAAADGGRRDRVRHDRVVSPLAGPAWAELYRSESFCRAIGQPQDGKGAGNMQIYLLLSPSPQIYRKSKEYPLTYHSYVTAAEHAMCPHAERPSPLDASWHASDFSLNISKCFTGAL